MKLGSDVKHLLPVILFATAGALFKTIAAFQGSRAALIDVLTCIANLFALFFLVYAVRVSRLPPDEDHPYGHVRFEVVGVLWITVIYGYVAGYGTAALMLEKSREHIPLQAPLFIAIGTALYAIAVLYARGAGLVGRAYAAFTASEIYEGIVVASAVLLGSLYTPVIDYIAAWGLLAYLIYELYEHVYHITCILTERVPPEVVKRVRRRLEERGLRVVSLRLRPLLPGEYVGDAIVRISSRDIREAHEIVDAVEKELRSKCNVHIVIHYEPE